jgi:hypothetical protein
MEDQKKNPELTKLVPVIPESTSSGGETIYPAVVSLSTQPPVFFVHNSGGGELILLGEVKAKVESVEKKIDNIEKKVDDLTDKVEGLESLFSLLEMLPAGIGDKIKAIRTAKFKTQK